MQPRIPIRKFWQRRLQWAFPAKKIIDARVLQIPNFDLSRYASLRENPVTILSDDCWGGYVYHMLDLPFTSPLINIYWPRDSFCKFIQDPFFYLAQPLRMVREGDPRKNVTPICQLSDGEKSIQLNMIHAANFQNAENLWNKRKERINKKEFLSNLDSILQTLKRRSI
ncbi:DUF1919 domain-containing protein [Oscillibacter sp.]|uniref:DUF1919 domain-containing protein n=1 Tax=Oscillibacter sp. TaxID=1945593 RepID=UPI0037CC4118